MSVAKDNISYSKDFSNFLCLAKIGTYFLIRKEFRKNLEEGIIGYGRGILEAFYRIEIIFR